MTSKLIKNTLKTALMLVSAVAFSAALAGPARKPPPSGGTTPPPPPPPSAVVVPVQPSTPPTIVDPSVGCQNNGSSTASTC